MENKEGKRIFNARRISKMRCLAGIIICSVVIVLTMVAFSLNIMDFYNDRTPEAGLGTLRMFTTLSNLFASIAAFMCLPFQIDGLRKNKYKLPRWIVELMYVGAVGTFLTFFVAITLISAYQGFFITMFEHSNLFMHTINPIFITLLFTLIVSDSHIKFSRSFFSLIPVFAYSLLYFIAVFVAKVWRDHYQTNTIIPWPLSFLLIILVAFGVSQLLRFLHNLTNKHVNKSIIRYYKESDDYKFPRVTEAIANLAKVESKFYHEGEDIYIPTDIIALLSERYNSNLGLDIQYDIYLENYLININKKLK